MSSNETIKPTQLKDHRLALSIAPLEEVAEYLNYKPNTFKSKCESGAIQLTLISFEENSQKAPRFICLKELSQLIDRRFEEFRLVSQELWSMNARS